MVSILHPQDHKWKSCNLHTNKKRVIKKSRMANVKDGSLKSQPTLCKSIAILLTLHVKQSGILKKDQFYFLSYSLTSLLFSYYPSARANNLALQRVIYLLFFKWQNSPFLILCMVFSPILILNCQKRKPRQILEVVKWNIIHI